ncbi:hypothetical protein [Novosphingobium sp. FKTRR1]|uniref:hypothetical protein n=1 Tax=Novosphingobium sp. FKTRR1 TaxID=2879118 RepID=UPI001CF0AF87|nr:hypothetical protein [Novosphingobium sp. FKTRR1]
MPDRPRYSTCGKQVLRGKQDVAQAATPDLARAIAIMLNHGTPTCDTPVEEVQTVIRVLWS